MSFPIWCIFIANSVAFEINMKAISRFVVSFLLIFAFLSNALPCGPGYTTPLFDTTSAPENPYSDFAAGRLGIIKPTFRRSVLYAAYRYIAGSGLSASEQQAMVEVWKAEIDNKDFRDDSVDEAVRAWVEKRADVIEKEEKTPDIYAERTYGGYEFFPNCTRNAFETAAETLANRASSHGPSDPNVLNWIKAQDQVFQNCAAGKQTPEDPPTGAPDWLQKDRAYQKAAAEFYSLDYNAAKRHFAEIALDPESPWQETADYLVARTLIRQASLTKDEGRAASFYAEAEDHLQHFISRSGKFSGSAERLIGLIKYRLRPKERVSELAKVLSVNGGNGNFRQDVIDYNWLLDKLESEVLAAEEMRKREEEEKKLPPCSSGMPANTPCRPTNEVNSSVNTVSNSVSAVTANTVVNGGKKDDDLEINLYSPNYAQTWRVIVKADATDEDAIAEAERVVSQPLTDEMKKQVREMRQSAYANRFKDNRSSGYEHDYYGDEKLTRVLIPAFLRQDDLTDWLFTFRMTGAEAYLYSLQKFKESGSELWLMTALSKADKSSTGLPRLLEAANNSSRTSPSYQTNAYHTARILLEQGKTADARKLIDEMLNAGDELPISTRNQFLGLRLKLAENLEDFLTFSLRKPYAFDFDGEVGSVDDLIREQKAYYDPEYNKDGRDAFDKEVEDRFKEEKLWQSRMMFDSDTIEVFNQHFPQSMLIEVEKSPALPDYLRERFKIAIWTRAYLLDDIATLLKITPELAKYRPEFEPLLSRITAAKTQTAIDHAVLYFVLKNPLLSPYIEDGTGKTDNEQGQFDSNDWWCAPYDTEYNEATGLDQPRGLPPRPKFLSPAQSQAAQNERKKLSETGDSPAFLAAKVLDWAKRYPSDRRVPESLYIVFEANGWTKYGCGNNTELHDEIAAYLRKHYPNSEWTAKIAEEEREK